MVDNVQLEPIDLNLFLANGSSTLQGGRVYAYYYDAVGNVVWIESAGGNPQYTFTQDAFGN